MKRNSASKSAQVIAFLKANSEEISATEKSKWSRKNQSLKGKGSKRSSRKVS
jgi:hypothetical protein